MPGLSELGWRPELAAALEALPQAGLVPARVAVRHGRIHVVLGPEPLGEAQAELSGRLFRDGRDSAAVLPAVGDWVALSVHGGGAVTIHAVLPRRGKVSRGVAGGTTEEQVLAAHVDLALVVAPLGGDLRLRRIERTLAIARAAGLDALVALTKSDLAVDPEQARREAEEAAGGAQVVLVHALAGEGVDVVRQALRPTTVGAPARTAVLLGPSGAGKSTLLNALIGEERQRVAEVRQSDGKGRHTTTHRELVLLPGGGCIIDSPGVRELAVWDDGGGIEATFGDVEALAATCRFGDCAHDTEPGCAVRAAIEAGDLAPERVESWAKLERELAKTAARRDSRSRADERRRARVITRAVRERMKQKGDW